MSIQLVALTRFEFGTVRQQRFEHVGVPYKFRFKRTHIVFGGRMVRGGSHALS